MTFSYLITNTIQAGGYSQLQEAMLNGFAPMFDNIRFFSDPVPSDCAQPDPADLLASGSFTMTPNGYGALQLTTAPSNITVSANGTVACFRTWDANNYACTSQGTVTLTGGDGDMTFDSLDVIVGNTIAINSFTLSPTVT